MTPNPAPHLTHEQLCDLILPCSPHPLSSDYAALEQHLRACPACSEELTQLSRSLTNFREASTALAQRQLAEVHARRAANPVSMLPSPHSRFAPALWLAGAAAVLTLAIVLPNSASRHLNPPQLATTATSPTVPSKLAPASTESDEAFLEEIDQAISTTVPSPMEPLADPSGGRSNHSTTSEKQN